MHRATAVLSLLLVAGCSGGGSAVDAARGDALADLWAALPGTDPGYEACMDRFATVYEFGSRYLACTAAQAFPLDVIVDRAPVAAFRSGPHRLDANGVALDLDAGRQFGHYDPAFVRWVTDAAVVSNGVARRLVAPIYNDYVARSARVYWLSHAALADVGFPGTLPDGPLAEYAAYLDGGPVTDAIRGYEGAESVSVYDLSTHLAPILPPGERVVLEDAGPNGEALTAESWPVQTEASTALAFWIRREADGTRDEWLAGLRGLLSAYDADWLASHGG